MAKTYTQFLTYVKYDFKRDDKDTEITQAYNDTIRHLSNMKPLEGRQFTSWITTTTGQEDEVLPSTMTNLIHPARIIESATLENGYSLNHLSRSDWTAKYINPNNSTTANITKGMPIDYCVYEKALHLGPVPDKSTYVIEIDWVRIRTIQAASSDIQELGEDWEEVIKWGTLARLYEGIGLTDEANRYWTLYKDVDLGYPALIRKEAVNTEKMEQVRFRDI